MYQNLVSSSRFSIPGVWQLKNSFYVLIPALLFLTWRYCKNHISFILILSAILSILIAEYSWGSDSDAMFYLLPSRMWELLAGSMLAKLEIDQGSRKSNSISIKIMPKLGFCDDSF